MPRISTDDFVENVPGLIFAMCIAFCGYAVWTQYKPISALMWSFMFGIAISNTFELPEKIIKGLR